MNVGKEAVSEALVAQSPAFLFNEWVGPAQMWWSPHFGTSLLPACYICPGRQQVI